MLCAPEIEAVDRGLFLWRYYDLTIKADLFSTGLRTDSGIFLIDPIPLAPEALMELEGIAGVIVTNGNHQRAATEFADHFGVPLHAAGTAAAGFPGSVTVELSGRFAPGLRAIDIEGAAAGEIAIHWDAQEGVMVMGDALINFDPYGFTFLPAKYCSNSKLMRRSLATLLDYSFERMLFAHGIPILSRAREKLEALLTAAQ